MRRFLCGFRFQRESVVHRAVGFLLLALAFGVAPAEADLTDIRVDVTDYSGTPANWNQLGMNATVTDLIDYNTGLATAIDVCMSGATEVVSGMDWTHGDVDWLDADAANSVIGGSWRNHPWQIVFSDLDAGSFYTFEVVASYKASETILADYTVNGDFADDNHLGIAGVNGDDFNLCTDGYKPCNWLIWTDVQTDSNGEITIESTFLGEWNAAYINAIHITSSSIIPLPSSILLAVLGLGTTCAYLKKKQA
ncbi:MAG: hypothetical protein JXM79_23900 [Sedimentisphaerales bacterium]|nr:hypothetical protein [Sedimentisphaerales bacterium]